MVWAAATAFAKRRKPKPSVEDKSSFKWSKSTPLSGPGVQCSLKTYLTSLLNQVIHSWILQGERAESKLLCRRDREKKNKKKNHFENTIMIPMLQNACILSVSNRKWLKQWRGRMWGVVGMLSSESFQQPTQINTDSEVWDLGLPQGRKYQLLLL